MGKHQLRMSVEMERMVEELQIAAVSLWQPTGRPVHGKSQLFFLQTSDTHERGQKGPIWG